MNKKIKKHKTHATTWSSCVFILFASCAQEENGDGFVCVFVPRGDSNSKHTLNQNSAETKTKRGKTLVQRKGLGMERAWGSRERMKRRDAELMS